MVFWLAVIHPKTSSDQRLRSIRWWVDVGLYLRFHDIQDELALLGTLPIVRTSEQALSSQPTMMFDAAIDPAEGLW